MPKFLTTTGSAHQIEEVIRDAKESLTLVTPYLKLSKNFIQRLRDANDDGIKITLVYGKETMKETERVKLRNLDNLEVFYCPELHAKCYFNESNLIITSMNLHEYSQNNNREIGILFTAIEDKEIYNNAVKEVKSIIKVSEQQKKFNGLKNKPSVEAKKIKVLRDKKYHEVWDFFMPELFLRVKKEFSKFSFEMKNGRIYTNLLEEFGVDFVIDTSITFEFKDNNSYENFKFKAESRINKLSPDFRVFWNFNKFSIYPPAKFTCNMSDEWVDILCNRYLNALKTIRNSFTRI